MHASAKQTAPAGRTRPPNWNTPKGQRTSILVRLAVATLEKFRREADARNETLTDWIVATCEQRADADRLAVVAGNNARTLGKRTSKPAKQVDLVEYLDTDAGKPDAGKAARGARRLKSG